jgi:hypothetical protein
MKPLTKKQIDHIYKRNKEREEMEIKKIKIVISMGTQQYKAVPIDLSASQSQYEFLPLTRITTFVVSREFISEAKQLVENMKRYGIIKESERINFDVIPETKQ